MPKLTNKGLEPIATPNQLTQEGTEEPEVQQNGAKFTKIEQAPSETSAGLSRVEQEISKAEHLLKLHERSEETAKETSRFIPVGGQRLMPDISEVHKTSIDKHVESMRFKIAWVANKLADELIHETSKKTKKDKEYIKGLVWSFGTMYDKLANVSTDTIQVHIPTKLLEGVKSAISIQIARVQHLDESLRTTPISSQPYDESRVVDVTAKPSSPEVQQPIDVTPIRSSPDVATRNDSVIATSTYDNHAEGEHASDNNVGITT